MSSKIVVVALMALVSVGYLMAEETGNSNKADAEISVPSKTEKEELLSEISPAMKGKLLKRALARVQAVRRHGKVPVFGQFYFGMPRMDALLIREANEIGSKDWTFDSKWYDGVVEDWRVDVIVGSRWCIEKSAIFKFIDCSDEAVLDQVIHQFVLKKTGTVSSGEYIGEYHLETEQSVTGEYYSEYVYKNTKAGIKIEYCKEKSYFYVVSMDESETAKKAVRDIVLKTTENDYKEGADGGTSGGGGSFFPIVVLFGVVCGGLYFFRAKIDAFVASHPKYERAWGVICKTGSISRAYSQKAIAAGKEKVDEMRNKKR